MLPNHAPLVIAEQFGTLDALYPGRIDLGLGRAPGTDALTAHALRRTLAGGVDAFPEDVVELMGYFAPAAARAAGARRSRRRAPTSRSGSSARACSAPSSPAALGLPYAFASHFAPALLMEAIDVYRRAFRPSDAARAPPRHARASTSSPPRPTTRRACC